MSESEPSPAERRIAERLTFLRVYTVPLKLISMVQILTKPTEIAIIFEDGI